ncbi:lipocalin-like domain-containing protein [Variovorax boronicumulans]|uniref:lipocalin-like domain-containing protein n=1 Tax=Variovorax boronicumulans TaxID=436515 RepID=UPI001C58FEAC
MNEVQQLIGTWRLDSFRIHYDDGELVFPMGSDAEGLIVYTPAGFMSGVLMQRGRPRFSAVRSSVAETGIGSTEEIIAAFNGYFSYFCRFNADPVQRKVTHSVIACHLPDWEGRTLERFWCFEDGADRQRLTLSSAPLMINGRQAKNELKFFRESDTFNVDNHA